MLSGSKEHIRLAHEQVDQNNPEGLLKVLSKAAKETKCLEKCLRC